MLVISFITLPIKPRVTERVSHRLCFGGESLFRSWQECRQCSATRGTHARRIGRTDWLFRRFHWIDRAWDQCTDAGAIARYCERGRVAHTTRGCPIQSRSVRLSGVGRRRAIQDSPRVHPSQTISYILTILFYVPGATSLRAFCARVGFHQRFDTKDKPPSDRSHLAPSISLDPNSLISLSNCHPEERPWRRRTCCTRCLNLRR